MQMSAKQIEILKILVSGNGTDPERRFIPCDLDQLIERLSYRPSKAAIQFSIRNMIAKRLIEKLGTEYRREHRRVLLGPTKLGRQLYRAETDPCMVEDDDDEIIKFARSQL